MTGISEEVRAERTRCAEWCERLAVIYDSSAAELRLDGTFNGVELTPKWPFFKKYSAVRPNWERVAVIKESAASAVRTLKKGILDGWAL